MADNMDFTMLFTKEKDKEKPSEEEVIFSVKEALEHKGYNPSSQMVGYLISGDPTYITSYDDARTLITTYERDELLEEIVSFYLSNKR